MKINKLIEILGFENLRTTREKVNKIIDYFWKNYNTNNKIRNYKEFKTWEEKGQREQFKNKLKVILKIGAKSWGQKEISIRELQKYGFGANYDSNDILELGFLPHTRVLVLVILLLIC